MNSKEITDILRQGNEYFFKYDNRIWGILKRKDGIFALSKYSEANEVRDMGHYFCTLENWEPHFSDSYKTPEALESFIEMYTFISGERKGKILGSIKILDDIISKEKSQQSQPQQSFVVSAYTET